MMRSNVRMIVSLTSCPVARMIEAATWRHRLIHVAVAHPMCSDLEWEDKKNGTTTIWIQPRSDYVALMLRRLSRMERPHKGIILTNGPSSTAARILSVVSQPSLGGPYSQDIYPSKSYNLIRGTDRTLYSMAPGIGSLSCVLNEMNTNSSFEEITTYVYLFTMEPHIQHELKTASVFVSLQYYLYPSR
ncbi:hypothetical protein FBUS_05119 [Fasciolopsis buskii]|uniref:Uncharacterized protein n=1 Tax=Fasciolopsis buskii TaxID=27845 RepID=A0A8E0S180_9TREM|nr:hypothetical protein FBUS_05119 [Fasciolopsis buski]